MSTHNAEPPVLLTKEEAAERLRVGPRTLWEWGRAGRLEVVHLTSRSLRYPEASVRRLMAGGDPNNGHAAEDGDGRE